MSSGSEDCRRCGRDNPSWYAPSPLWNKVMRGNDINGEIQFNDLVCVSCFTTLAADVGVTGAWRLTVDPVPDDLIYETPTGRVWDASKDLWIDPELSVSDE